MELVDLPDLKDRRVLLAVSGSIAAYKAAELCRLLVRAGARVQVVMTAASRRFVGEATFAALSGRLVATEMFDPLQEEQIGHIGLADEAELMVVAPATADVLAKMAHGIADDLVTTAYLAFTGPVLIAPAMNVHMWAHEATQINAATLRRRGHAFVGPASGEMACGHVGAGRMVEPAEVLAAAHRCLCDSPLAGRRLLVTAGPTREAVDPVRFFSNRSTGKMGYAIAAEAWALGAERVTLISGPSALACPTGVERVEVTSAAEMATAVDERLGDHEALIMSAAVADFTPSATLTGKLKKGSSTSLMLELERTRDILASVGGARPASLKALVGFAAETASSPEELDALAEAKRAAKGCDLLVANNVLEADAGFAVETNRVVFHAEGVEPERLPLLGKREVARRILDRIVSLLGGGGEA